MIFDTTINPEHTILYNCVFAAVDSYNKGLVEGDHKYETRVFDASGKEYKLVVTISWDFFEDNENDEDYIERDSSNDDDWTMICYANVFDLETGDELDEAAAAISPNKERVPIRPEDAAGLVESDWWENGVLES